MFIFRPLLLGSALLLARPAAAQQREAPPAPAQPAVPRLLPWVDRGGMPVFRPDTTGLDRKMVVRPADPGDRMPVATVPDGRFRIVGPASPQSSDSTRVVVPADPPRRDPT